MFLHGGRAKLGFVDSTDTERVFCQIVGSRLPSSRVYEDDRVVAFMVTEPVTAGLARIEPAAGTSGAAVKALLRHFRPDNAWVGELSEVRDLLTVQDRPWRA